MGYVCIALHVCWRPDAGTLRKDGRDGGALGGTKDVHVLWGPRRLAQEAPRAKVCSVLAGPAGWRGGSLPLLLLLLPGWEKGRREDASNRGTARHTYGTAPPRPATARPSARPSRCPAAPPGCRAPCPACRGACLCVLQ